MTIERPPIPTEQRKPVWRLACLAYRAKRREGSSDQAAHEAAVTAVQSVLPLPWKEASTEAVNAIVYTTKYHSEWFWRLGELRRGQRVNRLLPAPSGIAIIELPQRGFCVRMWATAIRRQCDTCSRSLMGRAVIASGDE